MMDNVALDALVNAHARVTAVLDVGVPLMLGLWSLWCCAGFARTLLGKSDTDYETSRQEERERQF